MVSEHAMLILVLLLAAAVVLLAYGMMFNERKMDKKLNQIAKQIEEKATSDQA